MKVLLTRMDGSVEDGLEERACFVSGVSLHYADTFFSMRPDLSIWESSPFSRPCVRFDHPSPFSWRDPLHENHKRIQRIRFSFQPQQLERNEGRRHRPG